MPSCIRPKPDQRILCVVIVVKKMYYG